MSRPWKSCSANLGCFAPSAGLSWVRTRAWGLEFRVQGLGFKVWGLGFRVQGLGFRSLGFGA